MTDDERFEWIINNGFEKDHWLLKYGKTSRDCIDYEIWQDVRCKKLARKVTREEILNAIPRNPTTATIDD